VLHSECPVPGHGGARRIELDGIALPLSDQLVVVAPNDLVVALDAGGRRLWEALQAGCTLDDLVDASVQEGRVPAKTARARIVRALASWRELGLLDSGPEAARASVAETPQLARPDGRALALDAVYQPGDGPVRVRCDDAILARVIEAACRTCRVEVPQGGLATVDVIEQDGCFAVRAEHADLARAEELTPNRALARHRCLTALLEIARRPRQWLGILHASAVAADGRCVVLPGARGSGKSTLAAALVAAGAELVTDDYAPLERGSRLVWPVPYAPGIKRGSWRTLGRRFPGLDALPVHQLAGLHIRYLELGDAGVAPLDRGLPVKALVFPRYEPRARLESEAMTAAEALAGLCHARSLMNRRPVVLAETLRWVETVPAYRLSYGDLDRAVEWIHSLLKTA
jgi:hypothetical protein